MAFISVIIPSFNRANLLQRALNSVYAQSLPAGEVIVIDDGSTDNTQQIVTQHFPQADYIYQDNQGVSAARNAGIKRAKGDWLAFLDSDDEWLTHKLCQQVNALKSTDIKVCHTEEIWIRKGLRVNQMQKHKKTDGWIFKHCLPLCAMSPSSIMIHRDVFDCVGLFDSSFLACEDYDLWLKITPHFPVLLIQQPQIKKYGGHCDQLSQKYWGMDRFRIRALATSIKSGCLNIDNKMAAINMLVKKAKIVQKGALKRGKNDEVDYYQELIDYFVEEINRL